MGLGLATIDYRKLSFLKRMLKNSLPHLSKEEKAIADELIDIIESEQQYESKKTLQSIQSITTGLSENQKQFVIDALMQNFTPLFDPYPVLNLSREEVFSTRAVYIREDTDKGYQLLCVE